MARPVNILDRLIQGLACRPRWLVVLGRGLGLMLCLYALRWLVQAPFFLDDMGPLARSTVLRDQVPSRYGFCLYMLNGHLYWGVLLLALQGACGLALIFQKRTRLAAWLGWFLAQSFVFRLPWVADNGAQVLAATLLWYGFALPRKETSRLSLNAGTVALHLQALANLFLLSFVMLGHPLGTWMGLSALLLVPLTGVRWVTVVAASVAWLTTLGSDPWLAVVCLVGLVGLLPERTADGEPGEVEEGSWLSWSVGILLVYTSVTVTAARLWAAPLSTPAWKLGTALGLGQNWSLTLSPSELELEARYFGGVRQLPLKADWLTRDRQRYWEALANDSTGWLSSRYFSFVSQQLTRENGGVPVDEIRLWRIESGGGRRLLRKWTRPTS